MEAAAAPPRFMECLQHNQTFGVRNPLLTTELARLERVIEADLPRVNALLRTAGQPEIVRSKVEAPVATPAPDASIEQ